jgi:phospholipase C
MEALKVTCLSVCVACPPQRSVAQYVMRCATIGMGFRVPLLIVSPWTRGGYVVSQVFDHTSVLQVRFLSLSSI